MSIEAFHATQQAAKAALEKAAVASVRDELRAAYDEAKLTLLLIVKQIPEFRNFVASVEPPPCQQVADWCSSMNRVMSAIPKQVSEAIDLYDRLAYSMMADNHSREILLRTTRTTLNSHKGALEHLAYKRAQILTWFDAWEANTGTPHPTAVPAATKEGLDVSAFVNKENKTNDD